MHGALGGFIRATRERAGLTQQQLAHQVFHSASWVRRLEQGGAADIIPADAERFAEVLHLQPWEVAYFYLMLGSPPPPSESTDNSAMVAYINALEPHPAVWVSNDGDNHANDAFRRLIPGLNKSGFIGAWFFSPAAKDAIANWSEVADWLLSDVRFRIAANADDQFFTEVIDGLIKAHPEFEQRWNAQIIPANPEPPTWLIRMDDGVVAKLDFRVWWQAHRQGVLVQGVDARPVRKSG